MRCGRADTSCRPSQARASAGRAAGQRERQRCNAAEIEIVGVQLLPVGQSEKIARVNGMRARLGATRNAPAPSCQSRTPSVLLVEKSRDPSVGRAPPGWRPYSALGCLDYPSAE